MPWQQKESAMFTNISNPNIHNIYPLMYQNAMKIIKPAEADRNWKYYTNKVKSSKKK